MHTRQFANLRLARGLGASEFSWRAPARRTWSAVKLRLPKDWAIWQKSRVILPR